MKTVLHQELLCTKYFKRANTIVAVEEGQTKERS